MYSQLTKTGVQKQLPILLGFASCDRLSFIGVVMD